MLTVRDIAATVIQRQWRRGCRKRDSRGGAGGSSESDAEEAYMLFNKVIPTRVALTLAQRQARRSGDLLHMDDHVIMTEKLDGTNLGVREDGLVFGRRVRVDGLTYQKTPISVAPDAATVRKIKQAIVQRCNDVAGAEDAAAFELPHLFMLYGELMINPGKFSYDKRDMAKVWRAFGATLDRKGADIVADDDVGTSDDEGEAGSDDSDDMYVKRLRAAGFWTSGSGHKVNLLMCPALVDVLKTFHIEVAPAVVSDMSLYDAVESLRGKMMTNDWEGVVVSRPWGLVKWKTGAEDESKGASMLKYLMELPSFSTLTVREQQMATWLSDVATSGVAVKQATKQATAAKKATTANPKVAAFTKEQLNVALASALTKYDSPDSYFASRGGAGMQELARLLATEIVADLSAKSGDEVRECNAYAMREMGVEFGKWKRAHGS